MLNPLVKISATLLVDPILTVLITPDDILSLTRCKSTSKCLVFYWKTRLTAIWITELLLQNKITESKPSISKSFKILFIQIISQVVNARHLYSDSAEDLDNVACFLLFQEIKSLQK